MKREILFRGKTEDNKWIEGDLLHQEWIQDDEFIENAIRYKIGYLYSFPIKVIPETVGQFTGLTDKNGKKIFDDDIVKHRFKRVWKTEFHTSKVVWNNEYSCYYLFDGVSNYKMRDDMEYEVLGNIHNNPELL